MPADMGDLSVLDHGRGPCSSNVDLIAIYDYVPHRGYCKEHRRPNALEPSFAFSGLFVLTVCDAACDFT
jgi:hypothetical protein